MSHYKCALLLIIGPVSNYPPTPYLPFKCCVRLSINNNYTWNPHGERHQHILPFVVRFYIMLKKLQNFEYKCMHFPTRCQTSTKPIF